MIEIKIILLSVTLIQLWIDWITTIPIEFIQRLRYGRLDTKPFNCSLCLSFWIGVIVTLITFNPLYLAMPLFNKVIEKNIY